ncbi:aminoglycoside adenylyltransferase family protein [Ochrobactrum quorumnocens]|nr:aminoglycoside adenylyltransferase family protein [[Ochrobactrum] quorumnocens]
MRVKNDKLEIPVEASSALSIVKNCFGTALLGVYLHGSAVSGGLRPNSDVDLLAIVSRPTTHADRKRLVTELLSVSGRYPHDDAGRRPLELIVFNRADLATSAYPARSEFVYGEWLRDAFETGEVPEPVSDPEFTLLLAQARQEARALIGPDPAELLPVIPESDIRRAIGDALPSLLGTLEGDERNVLLTLARMWRTLVTGEFVPKDAAAQWAMPRLPDIAATLLASAREGYLSRTAYDWSVRRIEARRVADELGERVAALLSHNSCRLSKNPD